MVFLLYYNCNYVVYLEIVFIEANQLAWNGIHVAAHTERYNTLGFAAIYFTLFRN